jgi:G3E family GTPase
MKLLPVNIISGFLGAGKTTAILQLLSEKKTRDKWAVIINEFGRVSIDGITLKKRGNQAGIFDVTGGCICCSAKGYFLETLNEVAAMDEFSRIIIEPSGLGGIEMVLDSIGQVGNLIARPVICLVDVTLITHPRFRLNPVYQAQIRKSDAVIFSKCDRVHDPEKLVDSVNSFRLQFPEVYCYQPGLKLSYVFEGLLPFKSEKPESSAIGDDISFVSDNRFKQATYRWPPHTIWDEQELIRFFKSHQNLLRAKGFVHTKEGWKLVNYTLSGYASEQTDAMESAEIVVIMAT